MSTKNKSQQSLKLKQGETLKNLGSKAIWPDWVPKSTQKVYKLRREKLTELQGKLKKLFASKTLTTPLKAKITSLTREIKTVVETDPTELFKVDKGKYLYKPKDFYTAKNPTQSHHIKGLDKYYEPMRKLDDFDLFELHAESAKKGHYFGNHPKNRIDLDRSLHVGRTRQAIPYFESIHGRIDFQDLSPDEYDDYIHKIINNEPTDTIGKPGGPKGLNRKRLSIPEASDWEYGVSNNKNKFFEMADADQALANEFKNKQTNPVLFKGKVKTPFIKEFINQNPDPSKWPKGVEEAIKNQDAKALIKLNKGIELKKVQDFDAKLNKHIQSLKNRKLGIGAGLLGASNFLPTKAGAEQIKQEVSEGKIGDATKTYGKDLLVGQAASRTAGSAMKIAQSKFAKTLSPAIARQVLKIGGRQLLKKGAALATGPAAPAVMTGLLLKDVYDVANVISGGKLTIKKNKDMTTDERIKAADSLKFIK